MTPVLTSVTGVIITTLAQNLTLAGQNFLTSNLVVTFTPAGGSASTVTVTPSSDTAATVAVPSAIYMAKALELLLESQLPIQTVEYLLQSIKLLEASSFWWNGDS